MCIRKKSDLIGRSWRNCQTCFALLSADKLLSKSHDGWRLLVNTSNSDTLSYTVKIWFIEKSRASGSKSNPKWNQANNRQQSMTNLAQLHFPSWRSHSGSDTMTRLLIEQLLWWEDETWQTEIEQVLARVGNSDVNFYGPTARLSTSDQWIQNHW